ISDIRPQTQTDAGADRHHDDVARRQRRHAEAADEISRAVDAAEALIDCVGGREVVHQHHRTGALTAEIPSDRRALPEHAHVAGILGVERSLAVAQAGHERAAALLPEDVTIGLTPIAHCSLDHARKPAGNRAEELMASVDQFKRGKLRWWR